MTNREYFDEAALTWDEKPGRVKTAMELASSIRQNLDLHENQHLLDFGCGTGLVSLSLLPDTGYLTGADTSAGMLDIFQKKIDRLNLTNCKLVQIDTDEIPFKPESFDVIISTMTFHHIPRTAEMIRKLYELLKPNGQIAIIDLDTEDGTFHIHGNEGVVHFGFDREEMKKRLNEAGFSDTKTETAYTVRRDTGREYPIFIVTGVKE